MRTQTQTREFTSKIPEGDLFKQICGYTVLCAGALGPSGGNVCDPL